jgi:hypothetical protein
MPTIKPPSVPAVNGPSGIQSVSDDLLASTRISPISQGAMALPTQDLGNRLDSVGLAASGAGGAAGNAAASAGSVTGATARIGGGGADFSAATRGTAGLGGQINGVMSGLAGRMPQIR